MLTKPAAIDRLRVSWVTNHQAPYREHGWDSLSTRVRLRLFVIHATEPKRHWSFHTTESYPSELLTSTRLPFRVAHHEADPPRLLHARSIDKVIADADVVVVHGWDQIPYLQILWACGRRGVPTLIFYASHEGTRRFSSGPIARLRAWAFSRADVMLTPGPAATAAAISDGFPEEAIVTSVNTIDVESVRRLAADVRRSLPSTQMRQPAHRFVFVGQLVERKNVDGLLRAVAKLSGDWKLSILGDGPQAALLRALARELAVADRVTFLGHVQPSAVIRYMAEAHTLVLPSWEEVWGMVVNEALACGLNVVLSRRAGALGSVVQLPGVFGFDPDDQRSFVSALQSSADAWRGWHESDERLGALSQERANADTLKAIGMAAER